jgi:hypothetical protein
MQAQQVRQDLRNRALDATREARQNFKRAASRYVDFNERIASRLFDVGERIAERAEQSPIYPLIEFQQSFARKAFEYWLKGVRIAIDKL